MPVRKVGAVFYVIRKDGSQGKRGFSTKAAAEKAQAKGRALAKRMGFGGGGSKSKGNPGPGATGPVPGKSKRLTVGKALDIASLAGPGAYFAAKYAVDKDEDAIKKSLPRAYVGIDIMSGNVMPKELIKGYGGAVNRAIEKKLFKLFRVRGPVTKMKTISDVVDYATYFGNAGMQAYERRGNVPDAIRHGYRALYGVDLEGEGTAAYDPQEMITKKWVPYIAQKWIFKGLRRAGIRFGM